MGAGGEGNHELGIGLRDIDNSGKRLSCKDQHSSHSKWSIKYLDERIIGMGSSVVFILICIVWLIDVSDAFRYAVSGVSILLLIVVIGIKVLRHKRLNGIRNQQLKEYRKQQRSNG
ncbi:hypothetical protein ACFOEK_20670 [Litoribrevibacter euphylliae]|uniref:Uncharacterized protein n=1 Tax=Litoribrevibacter euphylliae TaxID=1834034 RepID=A0ABV7HIK3_9GAMM